MTAAALTPFLIVMTAVSLLSFVILARAAWVHPRIGALTERTFIAFLVFMLGLISSILRYNADTGRVLFDQQAAGLIFAITILAILCVPFVWVLLFFTNRLGK